MKKITQIVLLVFIIIGLNSCLEKIEFERPDSIKNGIAIQGKLLKGDDTSIVTVTLRKVFDFTISPRFLSALEVVVIDEAGQELELKSKKIGRYTVEIPESHPFFKVEYGSNYKIRVQTSDNRIYESDFDAPSPVPIPTKLVKELTTIDIRNLVGDIEIDTQLTFFIDTPLKVTGSSENSRLLWEVEGIVKITDTPNAGGRCRIKKDPESKSCYVGTPPSRNYLTFNGKAVNGDSISRFILNETTFSNLFAEGYYFVVHQQSVSPAAFEYWSQVGRVVNRTGDIFQAPVGKVNTNIRNIEDPKDEVFGFFYATTEEVIRVYVSPQLARFPQKQCPEIFDTGEMAPYCCNCLDLEGSTSIKPDWWTE